MSNIISAITNLINAIFVGTPGTGGVGGTPSWISTVITTITASGNEVILIAVILPFVGLGVGLLKRLFSTKA